MKQFCYYENRQNDILHTCGIADRNKIEKRTIYEVKSYIYAGKELCREQAKKYHSKEWYLVFNRFYRALVGATRRALPIT